MFTGIQNKTIWLHLSWHHIFVTWASNHRKRDCVSTILFILATKTWLRSALPVLYEGIHRSPVDSHHKGPEMRKLFPGHDVIVWQHVTPYIFPYLWCLQGHLERLWSCTLCRTFASWKYNCKSKENTNVIQCRVKFSENYANTLRADSRFASNQWETASLCNDVSHWLGTSLKSALNVIPWAIWDTHRYHAIIIHCWPWIKILFSFFDIN